MRGIVRTAVVTVIVVAWLGLAFGLVDDRLDQPGNWAWAVGVGCFSAAMLVLHGASRRDIPGLGLSIRAAYGWTAIGVGVVTAASWTLGEYAVAAVGIVILAVATFAAAGRSQKLGRDAA